MDLSAAQQTQVRNYINSQPALAVLPNDPDSAFAIADALNLLATPDFIVWRTEVGVGEIMSNGFLWNEVDALTAGKARIWQWMTQLGTLDPSKPNVRQGVNDCWGAASAQRNAIFVHFKRKARVIERVLATGTGSDAAPATMTAEGKITYSEVQAIRSV